MIEVLWHGRGGQGAFTAARLLGAASSLAPGTYALAFPSFGPERRGAPMRAFTKMGDAPVGDRSAVVHADYVIYLDETLLGDGWEAELKPGGRVLVNSARAFADERIVAIDADGISQEVLGRPIPNTVLLGALTVLCSRVTSADVKEAIRGYMPAKLHAKNERIVDAAREQLLAKGAGTGEGAHAKEGGEAMAVADSAAAAQAGEGEATVAPAAPMQAPAAAAPPRPAGAIPTLRSGEPAPSEYAGTTCYEAGYLVTENAGWRNVRPVIDASACTGCLQCYLYCPDGVIYKVPPACRPTEPLDAAAAPGTESCGSKPSSRAEARFVGLSPQSSAPGAPSLTLRRPAAENGPAAETPRRAKARVGVAVDYGFCKGCGVCARECRFGAIAMVGEREALAAEAAAQPAAEAAAQPAAPAPAPAPANAKEANAR